MNSQHAIVAATPLTDLMRSVVEDMRWGVALRPGLDELFHPEPLVKHLREQIDKATSTSNPMHRANRLRELCSLARAAAYTAFGPFLMGYEKYIQMHKA